MGQMLDKSTIIPVIILEFILLLSFPSLSHAQEILQQDKVDSLIQLLKDDDLEIRKEAAYYLGQTKDRRAVTPLIETLGDQDRSLRHCAAIGLGELGDTLAIQALVMALMNDSSEIRFEASRALGKIGEASVSPITLVLREGDSNARGLALYALGLIGDTAGLSPIIQTLGDPDPIIRIQAVRALGEIDDSRRMGPLHKMLEDDDSRVRYVTGGVLARIKDPASVKPLIKALRNEEVPDPTHVVCGGEPGGVRYALTQIGEPAVEPLIKALRSCRWGIRYHSAVALGIIGDTQTVQPLIRRLRDCNNYVRRVAATALGRLKDTAAVEPLIDLLDEPSISAVWALGEIKDDRAIELLLPLLYSEHDLVKESALASLKKLGKPSSKDLINLVGHDDPKVRLFAVRALEWDTIAVECFISVLNKEDELDEIKEIAAWALVRIGDERAVRAMVDALLDDNIKVRAAALGFLGKFPVPEAIEPLLDFIEIYPNLTEYVLPILGGIGSEGVGPLLRFIKNEDPKIRATVAYALGKTSGSRAIEPLIETLKDRDPYPRRAAVYALKKLTGQGFSEDYKAWRAWWEENKEEYLK